MYYVSIKESRHSWNKQNLVTIKGRKGHYDEVICDNCGIKGRRYNLTNVDIIETYSQAKAYLCPNAPDEPISQRVKVTFCRATGKAFGNLTPDSLHDVVTPPEGYKNDHTGVWVMGIGEPVKLLSEWINKVN